VSSLSFPWRLKWEATLTIHVVNRAIIINQ
jgi:hypothetical protein